MNFTLEDKTIIKDNIQKNLDTLIKNFGLTECDYYTLYKNIEKIYDYTIKKDRIHKDKHGLTMLYIAHETFDILTLAAKKIKAENPTKHFKVYAKELEDWEVKDYYSTMFEHIEDEPQA